MEFTLTEVLERKLDRIWFRFLDVDRSRTCHFSPLGETTIKTSPIEPSLRQKHSLIGIIFASTPKANKTLATKKCLNGNYKIVTFHTFDMILKYLIPIL